MSIPNITDFNNPSNHWRSLRKNNLEATLLFVDLSKTFDSILRVKMEQIRLAYGLPQRKCYSHNVAL